MNDKHVKSPRYITHLTFRMPKALYITVRRQSMPDGRCLESSAVYLMADFKKTKIVISNLKRIREIILLLYNH